MTFVRSIGKFGLTALIVNSIIGSGIFGIPTELIHAVGRASPLAMIFAGIVAAIIMACFVEVASQFSEPGGAYLYTRTALGHFAGTQAGWFLWACFLVSAAANANLFVIYLSGMLPWAGTTLGRTVVLIAIIALPAAANYVGVKSGTMLSTFFCIAKLLPLFVLIALGFIRFGHQAAVLPVSEITQPGISAWLSALLLLAFSYAGYEFALTPGGEVIDPRRTVPVAMATAFLLVVVTYTAIQFVTVSTLGTAVSARPLADVASVLIGPRGALLVTIAAMCSTYGFISATILSAPRLTYSLAERGDFFRFFAALHPKFRTPHYSIAIFSLLLVFLSITGSFRWAVAVSSGAILIVYVFVCASLIQLRRTQKVADVVRIPFGHGFAVTGILIALAILASLKLNEAVALVLTGVIAAANWWWVSRKKQTAETMNSASAAD